MQKIQPVVNFDTKFNLYGNMLFKLSMVYMGNKEDAEEIMQEAFVKLLYFSPPFKDDEHEKAWLIRTTVNLCKDALRKVWRKRETMMEDIERYYQDPSDSSVIKDILDLPEMYKTVIHLHYYEDYSVRKIAEILKIKESAVKMRLQRARQLLKMELGG